jgi:radical SAM/Cys-rich protein
MLRLHDMSIDSNYNYNFEAMLEKHNLEARPVSIETLWVNITRLCNQACTHCHVNASPYRTEHMGWQVIDRCLEVLSQNDRITALDMTGGAPELHPDFDYFVAEARKLGKRVLVRHNLTVIFDGNPQTGERKEYLPEFFARQQVEIIASLPHYNEEYVKRQRGNGIFQKSLDGIRRLNEVGYGKEATGLILNLVHNADGPVTPDARTALEREFKHELYARYGLLFNKLFAVTNMPINRFLKCLVRSSAYEDYMNRLVTVFNPAAVSELVCRSLISVGYDGRLYDCDFNQLMEMQVHKEKPASIFNFDYETLVNRKIRFASHCFGCTAGGGSS